jgi:hypothetical protein
LTSNTKRWLAIVAIGAGVVIAGFAIFSRKSDEELIREKLERLAHAVGVESADENPVFRAKRLKDEFDELLSPNVKVEVPELAGFATSRTDLVGLATRAGSTYRHAEIELKRVNIKLDAGKKNAKADVTALLDAERGGEPERDQREVAFELHKDDKGWWIDSVSVSPKAGD